MWRAVEESLFAVSKKRIIERKGSVSGGVWAREAGRRGRQGVARQRGMAEEQNGSQTNVKNLLLWCFEAFAEAT